MEANASITQHREQVQKDAANGEASKGQHFAPIAGTAKRRRCAASR
jgi:hypothetical protein